MIKKYALVTFFFLAYLFTWSNWLPQALNSRGVTSVQVPGFLTLLSGYGPTLAAIIVVSLAYGQRGLREFLVDSSDGAWGFNGISLPCACPRS